MYQQVFSVRSFSIIFIKYPLEYITPHNLFEIKGGSRLVDLEHIMKVIMEETRFGPHLILHQVIYHTIRLYQH